MYSLDAILALTALMGLFALLLGAGNAITSDYAHASDALDAKTTALLCASIVDSIYANTASTYTGDIPCDAAHSTVHATTNAATKSADTTTTVVKQYAIEVTTLAHYLD